MQKCVFVNVCLCVCERERESVCVCVCVRDASPAVSQSCAISTHPHTLLKVRRKLRSSQRPLAVGTLTVHIFLQTLLSVAEYIVPLQVNHIYRSHSHKWISVCVAKLEIGVFGLLTVFLVAAVEGDNREGVKIVKNVELCVKTLQASQERGCLPFVRVHQLVIAQLYGSVHL